MMTKAKAWAVSASYLPPLLLRRFSQDLADIRADRLRYMLIFSLAPLFANMQDSFFARDLMFLGLDAMSWMGMAYCAGAGLLFAFASVKNMRRLALVLSVLSAMFFSGWIVMPEAGAALCMAAAFSFCFGGCAAVAAFGFAYALNDSERFLGAALTSLFCVLFQLDFSLGFISGIFDRAYMACLVAVTLVCMSRFKTEDYEAAASLPLRSGAAWPVGLALYFFFAHKAVEILYTYLPGASGKTALMMNGAVGVFVFALSIYLYFRAKFNIWHMCNIFFLGMIACYIMRLGHESREGPLASYAVHGFEQMGFIASYALTFGTLRRHAGFIQFKWILIASLCASPLLYALPGVISAKSPSALLVNTSAVNFALFFIFILLSPAYSRSLFNGNNEAAAISEGEIPHMQREPAEAELTPLSAAEQREITMKEKNLTPREQEIAALLLGGCRYKECAEQLCISADTVKYHARNIYHKLGVSGRHELAALFSKK